MARSLDMIRFTLAGRTKRGFWARCWPLECSPGSCPTTGWARWCADAAAKPRAPLVAQNAIHGGGDRAARGDCRERGAHSSGAPAAEPLADRAHDCLRALHRMRRFPLRPDPSLLEEIL